MALLIKIFFAAIFIATGGSLFSEKYKKYRLLAIFAGLVSILGAIYLVRDITDDISSVDLQKDDGSKNNYQCEENYLVIQKNDIQCDFSLSKNNEFMYKNEIVGDKLIATHYSDNTVIPANLLVVYPQSNSHRFAFVELCEFQDTDKGNLGLCWTSFVFDKEKKSITNTYAGKYGPRRWIKWSIDDKYFILTSTNEGANWIHAIETETGKSYEFPHYELSSSENAYNFSGVYENTFTWRGPRTFEMNFSYEHYDKKDYKIIDRNTKVFQFDITSKGLISSTTSQVPPAKPVA